MRDARELISSEALRRYDDNGDPFTAFQSLILDRVGGDRIETRIETTDRITEVSR
jgi:hypothetical protein